MNRRIQVVFLVAGSLGAVAVWRFSRGNDEPNREEQAITDAPARYQPVSDYHAKAPDNPVRVSPRAIDNKVAAIRTVSPVDTSLLVDGGPPVDSTIVPTKIAFPPASRYAYTPEGFRDTLQRSIEECKLPLALEDMDCSEYPCIAWGAWDSSGSQTIDLGSCRPWKEAFGQESMVVMRPGIDGGHARLGLYAYPVDVENPTLALKRAKLRAKEMLAASVIQ